MSKLEKPKTPKLKALGSDHKIVDLGDRMRAAWCAPLRQADAYWHGLRRGRVVPARSDVDPRGIEGILEYAFVAERIAPGHARIRIAGTHLCDLMGMEVRGMPLSALLSPVSRRKSTDLIGQLFDAPAQIDLALTAERRLGKPALNGRMMLLPLSDDFGDVSRVLGCLVTDGKIGRAPRRFEIVQHDVAHLSPAAIRPVAEPARGFGEPQAPFQQIDRAAPSTETRGFKPGPVPYLSIVTSQD